MVHTHQLTGHSAFLILRGDLRKLFGKQDTLHDGEPFNGHHHLQFNGCFQVNPGQPDPPRLSSSTYSRREPLWISGRGMFQPDALLFCAILCATIVHSAMHTH